MPKTPRAEVVRAIAHKLSSTSDAATLAQEVAGYLISEGREAELESIMRDVMVLRESDGMLEADVRVAHELDAASIAELTAIVHSEFPAAKQVLIAQTVDADMVGGMRIDTADQQLDLSVRGKLDTFKRLTNQGTM
jgi:F0F1-type ATP synthase delta subunit